MANLAETNQWTEWIYQIETIDPVLGGPNGVANTPHRQLASRTKHLRERVIAAEQSLGTKATQAALNALSQALTALQATVGGKASQQALDTLTQTVTDLQTTVEENMGTIVPISTSESVRRMGVSIQPWIEPVDT